MPSPGTHTILWSNSQITVVRLGNFDLESSRLKLEHLRYLNESVAPVLRPHGSLRLIGLAGRSGNVAYNASLGHRRAQAVVNHLRGIAGSAFAVAHQESLGESAAAMAGVPDGVEHPNWRSVIIKYWNQPAPPPVIERHSSPLRTIGRITQKNVPIPERSTSHEDGAFGNMLGQMVMQLHSPEVGVWESESVVVPDSFTIHQVRVTRQDTSLGSGWQSRLAGIQSQPQHFAVRFHWGPARNGALLWRGQTFDRQLTNTQAMRIYENPGAFTVGGMNIDRH